MIDPPPLKTLDSLASALIDERETVLARWREQVRALPSARHLDLPALNDHMPLLIAELASALHTARTGPEAEPVSSPPEHGVQRFEEGFDIEEVVAEYNILRDVVHDLAESQGVELHGTSRRIVDKCFDDAIAGAVKAFAASQAREVQRRRAEYLAFVAHDLRTPLSAITFSAHLLEQRVPGMKADAETTRLLKTLTRNAKQLDGLVASVLNENTHLLTELGVKLERRTFDLWPLVESLVQDLQAVAIRTGTRLVNQVPDDLQVFADASLLRRVLQNLISNAIAYTPRGTVQIGARAGDAAEPAVCWVSDTGSGIDADRLAKVFDVLEKDPRGDGMGLGLAIVKTFVEAHQGKVEVESLPGEGTTFRFTLPYGIVPVEAVAEPRSRPVAAPR